MSGIRSVKAWCIVKNGKLLPNEVYTESDVMLVKGEKLVRVTISCEKKEQK